MPSKVLGLLLALLIAPTVALAQSSEPVVEETAPVEEMVVVDQTAPPFTATLVSVGYGPTSTRRAELYPNPSVSGRGANSVPSPVGVPLFEQLGGSRTSVELQLANNDLATYSYTCGEQMCTGPARAVWAAIPSQQRHDYLMAVAAAFKAINPQASRVDVQVSFGGVRSSTRELIECASNAAADVVFLDGGCSR